MVAFGCGFILLFLVNLGIGILTYVVYPLGTFVIGLLAVMAVLAGGLAIAASIGVVGLLGCGLYSCPQEDTFRPWLKSFMSNMIAINSPKNSSANNSTTVAPPTNNSTVTTSNSPPTSTYSWNKWKSYCYKKVENVSSRLVNHYGPTVMINTLTAKMTVRYFHLGFCRLAFCSDLGTEGKEVIFVGAFNTWFPYSG
ncbi:Hypothetical protein HVR_LOCUS1253 [uncultured virus]|nr:Hypothetical protein HVR_LOCUS1253 [uncultured virus]